jgi:hypothetical protein
VSASEDPERSAEAMSITLAEAKSLRHGTILYDLKARNADGTAWRWRVNGQPRTWKRDPSRVSVPLKRGFWDFGYLDETGLELVALEDPTQ